MDAATPVRTSVEKPVDRPGQGWPSAWQANFTLGVLVFATFLNFLDATAFGMVVERIRVDFGLSNVQIGWLTGPANIIFYLIVLLPLSRLVDVYPRKYVLACGVLFIALMNGAGGLVAGFWALFATRMLVGAGGSAHAPGAYSILADSFRPERRALPFSILQLGFVLAGTWGFLIAGHLFAWVSGWPRIDLGPVEIYGWKWLLIILAVPGILASILLLLIHEPERRGEDAAQEAQPFSAVLGELWAHRAVYGPLFAALAFNAAFLLAVPPWLTPFLKRTYGWDEQTIGNLVSPILFIGQMTGLIAGPMLVNWLARRHRDAHVRATAMLFFAKIPFAVAAPLMPNGVLAIICLGVFGACGIAAAAPQNLAIQAMAPNRMRGQITGFYIMMFTVFGALGPLLIGVLTDKVFGHDADVGKALALAAAVLVPLSAICASFGVRPYGRVMAERERRAAAAAD
jgi:MFS family permease